MRKIYTSHSQLLKLFKDNIKVITLGILKKI